MAKTGKKFEKLLGIIKRLQAPNGCPWDKVQTHATLKPYMVEEIYEALEAIDKKNYKQLAEELGDLLLHICMHAEMGRKKKEFTIDDVIDSISAKMVRRHPHVFGKKTAKNVAEVWERWEKIKDQEKAKAGEKHKGMLDSIPQSLPALYRADKVQRRAARVGFDWDRVAGAWEKVYEEINEIEKELPKGKSNKSKNRNERLREEIGDLLFAVVNVARKLEIDAEESLQKSTMKFIRRFAHIEDEIKHNKLSINDMDKIWNAVKAREPKN